MRAYLVLLPFAVLLGFDAAASNTVRPPKFDRLVEYARKVAVERFPDLCGAKAELCGFAYDELRGCVGEIAIHYPHRKDGPVRGLGVIWVTFDRDGVVTDISLADKGPCRNSEDRTPA